MAAEDVQANVVLTADNSQYNQSMQAAATQTDEVGKSVDSLTAKIDNLAKSAGKKLIGFAAADVAVLTAATASYAAFEKQMESLQAQSAMLHKETDVANKAFKEHARNVNDLRRTYGETTRDAAALVQTISKMRDNTEQVDRLQASFSKLGIAVGESPVALANGMLQLQKTMGTSQRDTDKFNNQLATLQSRSNSSASAILEFSNSIAPVGRMVNMTQTDIMGFSNAFIKAGQDGYQAANVFNKMLSNIAYATQSGSPELAKYANLVGMTTENFAKLGGTDQYLKIFDAINRQGPQAITTLNRMGLDGMRTVRTVTAMAQQGGMGAEIAAARAADPNNMQRGYKAASDGIIDSMKKLRAELATTSESLGSNFAKPAETFIDMLTNMAKAGRMLMDSPIGKLAAWAAGLAAPFAAAAGAILLTAKAVMTFSFARQALTGMAASGFKDVGGMTDDQIRAMNQGKLIPGIGPGREAVGRGAGLAADERTSWANRFMYNRGADVARFMGYRGGGGTRSALTRMADIGARGTAWGVNQLVTPQFTAAALPAYNLRGQMIEGTGGYDDPLRRQRLFTAPTARASFGFGPEGRGTRLVEGFRQGWAGDDDRSLSRLSKSLIRANAGFMTQGAESGGIKPTVMTYDDAYKINKEFDKLKGSKLAGIAGPGDIAQRAEENVRAISNTAKATEAMGKEMGKATSGFGKLGSSVGRLSAAMATGTAGLAKFTGGLVGRGLGAIGMNPWMMGIMAAGAGVSWWSARDKERQYQYEDMSGGMAGYYTAGGMTAPRSSRERFAAERELDRQVATTRYDAYRLTEEEKQRANAANFQLTNKTLKGMSAEEAKAYLGTMWGDINKEPAAIDAAALDLVNVLGGKDAQKVLNQLRSGDRGSLDTLALAAGENELGWHKMGGGKEINKELNKYIGAIEDQAAFNEKVVGYNKSQQIRAESLESGFDELLGTDLRGGAEAQQTERAFIKNVLGSDKEVDYGFMGRIEQVAAYSKNTEELVNQLFKQGVLSEDKALRKDVLSGLGLDTGLTGDKAARAVMDAIRNPPKEEKTEEQKSAAGEIEKATTKLFGSTGILGMASVREALSAEGDVNAQYRAIQDVTRVMRGSGLSTGGQIQRLMDINAMASGDESLGAQYVQAAIQQIQQRSAMRAPYMSRTQQFSEQADIFSGIMSADLGPQGLAEREQAGQQFAQQVQEQYNYFKQMLYQQREYNVMRARAEEDFNLQRQYAQNDFELSRRRALQDYHIQRERAEQDFARSMHRNREDFQLSRKRQEEDHHHQVMLMIEAQAKAMYNMYERVKVQRTDSARWILQNSMDQTRRMQEQAANLDKLRSMGMKDDTIQQMGLTDPNNAQQLSRLVAEVAQDPQLVRQFNVEVARRLKAARKVVTDESSTDWQEFERSFRLARSRAQDDFERQMGRARADFRRGLAQQDDDFQRSLSRQQKDFATSMSRQEDAYEKSMNRSAEDLARAAKTIDGNFENILERAVKNLGGHARAQARTVLAEFRDLRSSIAPDAIATMELLADIFGVDYTPPKRAIPMLKARTPRNRENRAVAGNITRAAGGVLPGWSPGVDIHEFESPTAGKLRLSGGEAIMVPEWTKMVGGPGAVAEMNRRARGHSFASGGVFKNPSQRTSMDGEPVSAITAAQILLAENKWGRDIRVIQGSWQPRTSYSGSSHMGSGVVDTSPGNFDAQYWMRRVGFAAWGRNFPGAASAGSGAHIHAVSRLDPAARGHAQLSSFARGEDGLGGRDYGPNPSVLPGLTTLLKGFAGLALSGSGSPGGGIPKYSEIAPEIYRRAELAVNLLSQVQPFDVGDMSDIINKFGRQRYNELKKKYEAAFDYEANSGGISTAAVGGVPSGVGNVALGRRMAAARGWTGRNWDALHTLWTRESGWRHTANNPTSSAYGIPQALVDLHNIGRPYWEGRTGRNSSAQFTGGDPATQIAWGLNYIKGAYGNPQRALAYWNKHHSYGDGAIFTGQQTINVGDRGPEAVIPLNGYGANFLADIYKRLTPGLEAKQGNVRGSTPVGHGAMSYNYTIDRSTTFSGPITVSANNPGELINQLQARQRVMALSQPVLNGARG